MRWGSLPLPQGTDSFIGEVIHSVPVNNEITKGIGASPAVSDFPVFLAFHAALVHLLTSICLSNRQI